MSERVQFIDVVNYGLYALLGWGIGWGCGAAGEIRNTREEMCPAILERTATLTDSLSVAQRWEECEWWAADTSGSE